MELLAAVLVENATQFDGAMVSEPSSAYRNPGVVVIVRGKVLPTLRTWFVAKRIGVVTEMLTGAEVPLAPRLSVATAVSTYAPPGRLFVTTL